MLALYLYLFVNIWTGGYVCKLFNLNRMKLQHSFDETFVDRTLSMLILEWPYDREGGLTFGRG